MSAASGESGSVGHVEDDAELYALGALEPGERRRVDEHLRHCDRCARAVAAAEETVVALDLSHVARDPAPARLGARIAAAAAAKRGAAGARWRRPSLQTLTAAASLALTLGAGSFAVVEHSANVRDAARESAILATLSTSHFVHVSFRPNDPDVPAAKAIYDPAGAWLYVIVDAAACRCRVVVRTPERSIDLGPPQPRGATASLFARETVRPESVALVGDDGHVLAEANLAYASSSAR